MKNICFPVVVALVVLSLNSCVEPSASTSIPQINVYSIMPGPGQAIVILESDADLDLLLEAHTTKTLDGNPVVTQSAVGSGQAQNIVVNGLDGGTTYYFLIKGRDSNGTDVTTWNGSDMPVTPTSPSGDGNPEVTLGSVNPGDGQIVVNFSAGEGIHITFEVYASADFQGSPVLTVENIAGTGHPQMHVLSDPLLVNGQDYYLRVRGKNTKGEEKESPWPHPIRPIASPFTINSVTPRNQQLLVNVIVEKDLTVSLEVVVSEAVPSKTQSVVGTGSPQDVTVEGLENGVFYTVSLKKDGPGGSVLTYTYPDSVAPTLFDGDGDPEVTLDSVNPGDGQIAVNFSAGEGIHITFEVYASADFQGSPVLTVENIAGIGHPQIHVLSDPLLVNGQDYYLKVKGKNTKDEEKDSTWPNSIRPGENPPEVHFVSYSAGIQEVTISVKGELNSTITLEIHTGPAYDTSTFVQDFTVTGMGEAEAIDITVTGLDNFFPYFVRGKGTNHLNEDGTWKEYNQRVEAYRAASVNPGAVTAEDSKIIAAFTAPLDEDITLELHTSSTFSGTAVQTVEEVESLGTTQEVSFYNLDNFTSYYLRARGKSVDEGLSDWAAWSGSLVPGPAVIEISRLEDLAKIGVETTYPANWDYLLTADLSFSDANNDGTENDPYDADTDVLNGNWLPLRKASNSTGFSGTFDGGGHTITGMEIKIDSGNPNVYYNQNGGFFYKIEGGGLVKNLNMANAILNLQNGDERTYVGVIAGHNAGGNIDNVIVSNATVSGNDIVGGIVGGNSGEITNSQVLSSEIRGKKLVAGIVGKMFGGSIKDSSAVEIEVVGSDYSIGGIAGWNYGTIRNTYATGTVQGDVSVGGLIGIHGNGTTVADSYASCTVSGTEKVGGLIGSTGVGLDLNDNYTYSRVENTYAIGNVSGDSKVGGLVGQNGGAKISNSYAKGDVSGNTQIGGFVGLNIRALSNYLRIPSVISNSYSTGKVEGTAGNVGGLVGENYGSYIRNSYALGEVRGSSSVGGLVGYHTKSFPSSFSEGDLNAGIDNSFAVGNVFNTGDDSGGLVGLVAEGALNNNYRYAGQSLPTGNNDLGTMVESTSLKLPSWYTDTLNWKAGTYAGDEWHISGLVDGTIGYFPHINRKGETGQDASSEVPEQDSIIIP